MSSLPVLPDVEEQPLSDEAKRDLLALVRGALKAEQSARRSEVIQSRQQRFYERGHQHIDVNPVNYTFRTAAETAQAKGIDLPKYMGVYNIYRPYQRSLIAINTQNPPGIVFRPKQLSSSTDVTAAKTAETFRHAIDQEVNMKDVQTKVARDFTTDARVITWTRADDEGKLKCTVHGVLESKVPIFTSGMDEWNYCILSREVDIDIVKDKYPDDEEHEANTKNEGSIRGGSDVSGDDSYERVARLGVLGGRRGYGESDYDKELVTEHTVWFRSSRFRRAKNSVDELKAVFPDGVRVVVCGDRVCEAVAESMDDCLAVAFPSPGDGMNRSSLLRDLVDLQDAFNDLMNMIRENLDYNIPSTWLKSGSVDEEAIGEQRAAPGTYHFMEAGRGPLSENFFVEAPSVLPADVVNFAQMLMGEIAQFITGALPSLFGGGTPDSETASGQEALRNQAMGGLSPVWAAMQWLFAKVYEQAVKAKAKAVGDQDYSVDKQDGTTDSVNPATILFGNFGAYPDQDSSFPETTAAKRTAYNQVSQMLAQLPGGPEIVGSPDNLKLGKELNGLEDFIIPQAESRDKQQLEISQLLKEQPVPDVSNPSFGQWQQLAVAAHLQGQPVPQMPLKSSLQVGKRDFHQWELDYGNQWFSSDARRQEEKRGNMQGVQNVDLHLSEHEAAIKAATPPPQGKPPSVSIALGDVTDPAAKAQILQEAGIQTTPQDLEEHQGAADAKDITKAALTAAHTGGGQ